MSASESPSGSTAPALYATGDWAWTNGELTAREAAAPSVASASLHLGTAVFDGLMAYWNADRWYLHLGREHLDRFRQGAARMMLPFAWSTEELKAGVLELLERCEHTTQYVRPIAYRGSPEIRLLPGRSLPVTVCMFATPVERDVDDPMTAVISPVERISSAAIPVSWKISGAYANSVLAQADAHRRGADTALLLDRRGRICEASAANVFFITSGGWATPSLDADVFPGLTRKLLLKLAEHLGITVVERDVFPSELSSFSGALLASTLLELRPLSRIGDRHLAVDAELRSMIDAFRKVTHAS